MKEQTAQNKKIVVCMGLDIAKNVFQIHGINKFQETVLRKRIKRNNLLAFMATLSPCRVGMEACGSAHHWARELEKMGHDVKLMPGQHVKPYRKNNKTDRNDAEAICEAVGRPTMRFIPIKSFEQHDIQSLHRTREQLIKIRTMQVNHIRGLLNEYGVVVPKGITKLRKAIPIVLENAENQLTSIIRDIVSKVYESVCFFDAQIQDVTAKIELIAKNNEICRRLMGINGIGALGATAFYAAVGSGKQFRCGRDAAAWLGLVPRQHSSGDKKVMLGISNKGNRYLRKIFIHGARSVVSYAGKKDNSLNNWIRKRMASKGKNIAAVALANKNTRIAWALLTSGEPYRMAA